ncbi:MAG: DUF4468 domain-containing protein [Bacteroidales bacterium]|nr:DUF4468 domain-containing protein [Bacteroidales bacterium]
MKRYLLAAVAILLMCLAALAQTVETKNYLAGAVTTSDGKVVFSAEFKAPTLTQTQLYDLLLKWSEGRFVGNEEYHMNARVLYQNPEEGVIADGGEEWMVFTKNAISLDRTRVYYRLTLTCRDGSVDATISNIRYLYDENRDGGRKMSAEEAITDEVALNKSKTKLVYMYGKFRRETVDLKDDLFTSIRNTIANAVVANDPTAAPAPVVAQSPVATVAETPAVAEAPATVAVAEEPAVAVVEEPAVASETPAETPVEAPIVSVAVTDANGEQLTLDPSAWGGVSSMMGQPVAYIFVAANKALANAMMEGSDTYTIALGREGASAPESLTARRMSKMTMSGKEACEVNSQLDPATTYNVYLLSIAQ